MYELANLPTGSSNDVIHGSLIASNCVATGLCHWNIVVTNKTKGTWTSLDVNTGRAMKMAYPGVYERYNVSTCDQNPASGVGFGATYVYMPSDASAATMREMATTVPWQAWPSPPVDPAKYPDWLPACNNNVILFSRGTTLQY